VLIGKNNQDAWRIHDTEEVSIVLVADGCGSKPHSEVGSNLAIQALTASLERNWVASAGGEMTFPLRLEAVLEGARRDVVSFLGMVAKQLLPSQASGGGRASYSELVSDYMLFTIVGALVTSQGVGFFSIGDGLIVINGEQIELGPFPGNEPPYMAYALLRTRWTEEELQFKVHRCCPLEEVETFLIGSDGVLDLAGKADVSLPGSFDSIGALSQFWTEGRFFTRSGIRNRLARMQSRQINHTRGDQIIDEGRLLDDTTLIVARRGKKGQ